MSVNAPRPPTQASHAIEVRAGSATPAPAAASARARAGPRCAPHAQHARGTQQHARVRLDPHGRPQREGRDAEPSDPPRLRPHHRRDDATRAPREAGAEQELPLSGEPRAARDVIESEEGRSGHGAPYPGSAQRDEEAGGDRKERREIEHAERQVPRPEREEEQDVRGVHARKVHVEQIAIGGRAPEDPPRDVVQERSVVDQRPASGEPHEAQRSQADQRHCRADEHGEPPSPDALGRHFLGRRSGAFRGHRIGARDTSADGVWLPRSSVSSERAGGQECPPVRP